MEDLKGKISLMSTDGRVGLTRSLVETQLKMQLGSWEDFVRIICDTTDLTREELEDARKFIEGNDDTGENSIGEATDPEDGETN